MKIALVTGANKGIGKEAARQLAKAGFKVLVGSRDHERGKQALSDIPGAELVILDTADEKSIHAAAAELSKKHKSLDVLVNNAGVYIDRNAKPSELPLDVLRETYDVNFFGCVAMMQAFLPLLRKAPAARVVNVSSTLGSIVRASMPLLAYNTSKTALNAASVCFAKELAGTKIKVNAVCPGWVKTDMGTDAAPRSVEQGARIILKMATLADDGPTGGFFDDAGEIPW